MTAERKKPELLAPAGDWEKLQMAVLYGADAVYLAGTSFGMRSFAGNFSDEELPRAVDFAHRHGVKVHATVNTMPRSGEVDRLPEHLEKLNDAGVDALILADLGAFILAGKYAPRCQRHISTQQSIANYACAQAWFDLGAQRVVLARELGMDEIREIRRRVDPALELETFCHGAMCVSYSGRCLLSNYMTGRDSNRGACAQPCRYQYALLEEKRPGEYMPVCEDENGTYIFSAHDLNLMPLLPELVDAGIKSLKIEGRMKTAYYVATVTAAYRRALDLLADGGDFAAALPGLMAELSCASHRDSDTGFALGKPANPGGADGFHQEREYLAHVVEGSRDGRGTRFLLKNRFKAGETIELLTPSGVHTFEATPFLREKTGEIVDTLGIGDEIIRMDVPFATQTGDFLRGETRNHRK